MVTIEVQTPATPPIQQITKNIHGCKPNVNPPNTHTHKQQSHPPKPRKRTKTWQHLALLKPHLIWSETPRLLSPSCTKKNSRNTCLLSLLNPSATIYCLVAMQDLRRRAIGSAHLLQRLLNPNASGLRAHVGSEQGPSAQGLGQNQLVT